MGKLLDYANKELEMAKEVAFLVMEQGFTREDALKLVRDKYKDSDTNEC